MENKKLIYGIIFGLVMLFIIVGCTKKEIVKITNFEECAKAGYPIAESYPRQCHTPDGKTFVEKIDTSQKEIEIEGEVTCLPSKRGTEECAFGLKGKDGKFYGLEKLNQNDLVSGKLATGDYVTVKGILKSGTQEFLFLYDAIGVIEISSITQLTSSTTKGIVVHEDPEKSGLYGLYNYPDSPLDSILSEPISIKYLVEHRSALDGKSVTVKGVVVSTLLGEAACPPGFGMCAQPRIFLADSNKEDRDKNYDVMVLVSEEEKGYKVGDNAEVKGTVYSSKTVVYLHKIYEK